MEDLSPNSSKGKGASRILVDSMPFVFRWLVFQILAGLIPISGVAASRLVGNADTIPYADIFADGGLFISCSIAGIAAVGNFLPLSSTSSGGYQMHPVSQALLKSIEYIFVGLCLVSSVVSAVFYSAVCSKLDAIKSASAPINIEFDKDFVLVASVGMYLVVAAFGVILTILREARR